MDEGSVSSNARHCPACGRASGHRRGRKNDFQLLSCQTCATLYTATNPDPNQEQDYDAYYTAENLIVPTFINSILDEIVATFELYRRSNRLLDVGCGAGTFLEAVARGLGSDGPMKYLLGETAKLSLQFSALAFLPRCSQRQV
jgi:hypothetical protein